MFIDCRKKGGEREKHQLVASCMCSEDWACNLGTLPDWELNLQPFGVWDGAPTDWATQPGLDRFLYCASEDLAMERKKFVNKILIYSHLKTDNFHFRLFFSIYFVGET